MSILFETTYALTEIDQVATQLLVIAKDYEVWALSGNLGAGKTTLTVALLKALGSKSHVSSPTFSIINQYEWADKIVHHADWYRIGDEEEAINAGIEDMLVQPGIKIVEWWENVPNLLPKNTIYIYISTIENGLRKILCSEHPIV